MIDPEFLRIASGPIDPKHPPKLNPGDAVGVMLISLLQGVLLLGLSFSAPLIYWKQMPLMKSVFYSVFGVLGALRSFVVMLLTWLVLFIGACMLVAALTGGNLNIAQVIVMWLVLLFVLVLQCALYIAYRQIFGDPDLPAAPS